MVDATFLHQRVPKRSEKAEYTYTAIYSYVPAHMRKPLRIAYGYENSCRVSFFGSLFTILLSLSRAYRMVWKTLSPHFGTHLKRRVYCSGP